MPTKRLGIAEALREAIAEEMERDARVFCLGEDIGVPGGWGGAFTVTPSWASSASRSARP
jgi:pyruvate dehydrogenase E1 component beta subunit